jgi:transposase-like protein
MIRRQVASGLSVVAFCRQEGIPQSTFFAWQRKLRDEAALPHSSQGPNGFAEVKVSAAARPLSPNLSNATANNITGMTPGNTPTNSSGIELHLPGRRRVVVRPGFDRQTLRELLRVLSEPSLDRVAQETDA